MTVYINGHAMGDQRPGTMQEGGMRYEAPESPGNVIISAYKTGVEHDRFTLEVSTNASDIRQRVQILSQLCKAEPCVYIEDDESYLYGNVSACWALINYRVEVRRDSTLAKHAVMTLNCLVTEDTTGTTYSTSADEDDDAGTSGAQT